MIAPIRPKGSSRKRCRSSTGPCRNIFLPLPDEIFRDYLPESPPCSGKHEWSPGAKWFTDVTVREAVEAGLVEGARMVVAARALFNSGGIFDPDGRIAARAAAGGFLQLSEEPPRARLSV